MTDTLLRTAALLVGFMIGSPPVQAADANGAILEVIDNTADRICGSVQVNGSSIEAKGNIDARAELQGLAKHLADLGVSGGGRLVSDQYVNFLRSDLATVWKSTQECKLSVLKTLEGPLLERPAQMHVCRAFDLTRDSGWRGGGYDPTRWCEDVVSMVRGEQVGAAVSVVEKSEQSKNTCAPFNCPQYLYVCKVHVEISSATCP